MRLNHAALLSWVLSIALALALERTGALHLFYLFLPVYAFAAGSYILLARAMGAALPRGSHESRVESHESQRPAAHEPEPATASPTTWFSGAAAAAALGVCLWLAVGVAASSASEYDAALESFKSSLAVPTLAYFIAGTVFFMRRAAAR